MYELPSEFTPTVSSTKNKMKKYLKSIAKSMRFIALSQKRSRKLFEESVAMSRLARLDSEKMVRAHEQSLDLNNRRFIADSMPIVDTLVGLLALIPKEHLEDKSVIDAQRVLKVLRS